jgi:hypothetical protein
MDENKNIKALSEALRKKNKKVLTLPWRHLMSSSILDSLRLIRKQTEGFAVITTDQDNRVFVTMPYQLYLSLLKAHVVAESFDEEL